MRDTRGIGGNRMDGVTRRKCIAMAGVPVLAGLGAHAAARERGLSPEDTRTRFARAGADPRALLQQRHLPNLPLVTHDGERVRFYDDLVKDKKVVLTFVSSRVPAQSSTVTRNLAAIQRLFGARVGKDPFLYSVARDPRTDDRA